LTKNAHFGYRDFVRLNKQKKLILKGYKNRNADEVFRQEKYSDSFPHVRINALLVTLTRTSRICRKGIRLFLPLHPFQKTGGNMATNEENKKK
jgi:hypothetical protein